MCRKCSVVSRAQWNFEEIAVNEPTWWGSTIILSKERGRCKEHLGTAGLLGSTEPPARDAFFFFFALFSERFTNTAARQAPNSLLQ